MFQYACGKALALELGVELKLDISFLADKNERENFTVRDYELGVFRIVDKVADIKDVRRFIPDLWNCTKVDLLKYKFLRLLNGNHYYYEQKKFQMEERISQISDKTYLYGYFQTEKYFTGIRNELLSIFELRNEPDDLNQQFIEQLSEENAVSIHVRRGDYHNSPFTLLGLSYYRRAIEIIKEEVLNPRFYVFTNDADWVRDNFQSLGIDLDIIMHNQGQQSYMDMVLMSQCKHNICANSSFSWWGAWLNQNADKVVVTPQNWFKDKSYVSSTFDLIPATWLQI